MAQSQTSRTRKWCTTLFLLAALALLPEVNHALESVNDNHNVLITGSNRGIGLEFARQYAALGHTVIASCRNPEEADELRQLAAKFQNIQIEELDITDIEEIDSLAEKYRGKPIHILINNAALLGGRNDQAFGSQDFELAQQQYAVNALGPLRIATAFIDNIRAAGPGKIITLGSAAGSNGYLRPPADFYSYRASKAAQHFLIHNLAIELASENIVVGLVNPGLVDTRGFADIGPDDPVPEDFEQIMKLIRAGAIELITPAESVSALIELIDTLTPEQSGVFLNYDGQVLPW